MTSDRSTRIVTTTFRFFAAQIRIHVSTMNSPVLCQLTVGRDCAGHVFVPVAASERILVLLSPDDGGPFRR